MESHITSVRFSFAFFGVNERNMDLSPAENSSSNSLTMVRAKVAEGGSRKEVLLLNTYLSLLKRFRFQNVIAPLIWNEFPSTVFLFPNSLNHLKPKATWRAGRITLPPTPIAFTT
jgi:hypothetical protein